MTRYTIFWHPMSVSHCLAVTLTGTVYRLREFLTCHMRINVHTLYGNDCSDILCLYHTASLWPLLERYIGCENFPHVIWERMIWCSVFWHPMSISLCLAVTLTGTVYRLWEFLICSMRNNDMIWCVLTSCVYIILCLYYTLQCVALYCSVL